MLEFRLLGDVAVLVDGRARDIGPPRQQSLLAALLVEANHALSAETVIDRMWGHRRPRSARDVLYSYVCRLRHRLRGIEGVELTRNATGYLLTVERDAVDLYRFHALLDRARSSTDEAGGLRHLEEALGLWRGDAFGNLDTPWLNVQRGLLAEHRHIAQLDRDDMTLRRGGHAALVPALTARVRDHPLDERVAAQLMLALYRCGRQADALACYERLRRRLADALGVGPGPEVRDLHLAILKSAVQPTPPAPVEREVAAATWSPQQQLPPSVADFTGREAAVRQVVRAAAEPASGPRVVTVRGPAGAGKSTLALHAAHRLIPAFPDGQLYAELRGTHPEPADPFLLLGGFLQASGLPGSAHGGSLTERVARFREVTLQRRVLVLLDDAGTADQVRPLVPGGAGCVVIVTARRPLTGLEDAVRLDLAPFRPAEAEALLARIVGPSRAGAEPAAAAEIARLCGFLPLAVRIAGTRLAARPQLRLGQLAERLRDEQFRLDELASGELDVRAGLDASYRALPDRARRLFLLLSMLAAPDVPAWVAAALLDTSVPEAAGLLAVLSDAGLTEEVAGTEPARYAMHDLVRIFGCERAAEEPEVAERVALVAAVGQAAEPGRPDLARTLPAFARYVSPPRV